MGKLEKIKPMLPSLREKKRYLAFEIVSKEKIDDFRAVEEAVWNACLNFLGELGTAKAGIMPIGEKWHAKKQRGLIRVNRKYVDHVRVALSLVRKISSQKVIIKTVGVSGIMQKAESKYVGA